MTAGVVTVGGKTRFEVPVAMRPHVERVFRGEYEVGVEFDKAPRVLDVGANIGSFAVWAGARWETESITCYEPHPENFRTLTRNMLRRSDHVKLVEAAVVGDSYEGDSVDLYPGLHNCGESSLFNLGEQDMATPVVVKAVRASALPPAEVLKLDTEGAEVEILKGYDLRDTVAVLLEWHAAGDRRWIDAHLSELGFDLVGSAVYTPQRGILKFVRA